MRYILNSAVITNFGTWEYRPLTIEQATEWLRRGDWVSTVRYQETAQVITRLTGVEIPLNNKVVVMKPGDEALVFRIKFEEGGGRIAPELKGKISPDYVANFLEIGLLRMISAAFRTNANEQ